MGRGALDWGGHLALKRQSLLPEDYTVTSRTKTSQEDHVWARSWARAVAVSVVIVLALWLGLAVIPSRLIAFLDERGLEARLRDAAVALVFTAFFVGIVWTLTMLQRKGRI